MEKTREDYEASSKWVKEHVEKSTIATDWSARGRQEKHALSSALLRVRGRLREEHNKILADKQRALIQEEEVYLRKRLRDVEMDVNRPTLEIISAILKSFNACFHDTLNSPHKDYPHLLSVDTGSSSSPVVAHLRDAASAVCEAATRYVVRKGDRARLGLDQAIEGILRDIDTEGENIWQNAVARASEGWQEGGEFHTRFLHEIKKKDDNERRLVEDYVADQTRFAMQIAERDLRTHMRESLEAAQRYVEDMSGSILLHAKAHRDDLLASLDRDELHYFEDDKGTSSDMGYRVSALYDRIACATRDAKDLFRGLGELAQEVAVLRHGKSIALRPTSPVQQPTT